MYRRHGDGGATQPTAGDHQEEQRGVPAWPAGWHVCIQWQIQDLLQIGVKGFRGLLSSRKSPKLKGSSKKILEFSPFKWSLGAKKGNIMPQNGPVGTEMGLLVPK